MSISIRRIDSQNEIIIFLRRVMKHEISSSSDDLQTKIMDLRKTIEVIQSSN